MDSFGAKVALENVIAFETLGCKLNQAESESLARQLLQRGYTLTSFNSAAAIYILNTCTVTSTADRKARHLLRTARRNNPNAIIVAMGCYAEHNPELLKAIGADLTIGTVEKDYLLQILEQRGLIENTCAVCHQKRRTRSLVKIQEGCNQFCSYCIVPLVRGSERNLPLDTVIANIRSRVEEGHREVVLTGTRIGTYKPSLATLIRRILSDTNIHRLRLSSLQPAEITDELLSLFADSRLCKHMHLPLQSGSDHVLRLMRRPYSTSEYVETVTRIREVIPDAAITTDIMVGFPGETDKEFSNSHDFCRDMAFANIHVFPYSKRPGTRAALADNMIDEVKRRERRNIMLKLGKESARNFRERFIDHTMMVLWEQQEDNGLWTGLTDNYIRVFTRSNEMLENTITATILVHADCYQEKDEAFGQPLWDQTLVIK
jgi:threonylcarbamoyladenosine tRNA methylthiotransferase MtaB